MSEVQKGRITVEFKVYKTNATGKVSYDENGKVLSESQKLTLTYGDLQFTKHLSNLPKQGWGKIEVVALHQNGKALEDAELLETVKKEITNFYKQPEKVLSADEQRIADLEAKLEALQNLVKEPKEEKEPKAKRATNKTEE
jgi:hypothetical protein